MAIKIRCVDCKKKISIDEAFAGGVCRCPYCTAIVYVPDDTGTKKVKGRPAIPTRRPEAPTPRPEAPTPVSKAPAPVDTNAATALDAPAGVDPNAETAIDPPKTVKAPKPFKTATQAEADKTLADAHGQTNIPTAAPVKVQGIVSIILAMLLVGMLVGMVLVAIQITNPPVVIDKPKDYDNTAITTRDFPAVAGTIKVTAPVVYCIDTSKPMIAVFEAAGNIVIASAKSLKDGTFNIILIGEDGDKILSPQPIAADKAGIDKAKAFLVMELCGEADQARGLQAALDMNPKTVVLLARDTSNAKDVATAFKTKSVPVHTVVLAASSIGMEELSKLTDGESKSFTESDLQEQAKRADQQP
jgi:hypothetical protein